MMLQILINHLIGYVTCAPGTITYCPEMATPIAFAQFWILFLQTTRCPPLQTFNKITNRKRRTIFYMNVNMILAHNSFQNTYIFRIADLLNKFSATKLNITNQNLVTILGNPYNMHCQPSNSMTTNSLFFTHSVNLTKCVATESLALKAHSFN